MVNNSRQILLVVEDNLADVYLVQHALDRHGLTVNLHVLEDGEKALKFIEATDRDEAAYCPALILLDLNLPRVSGKEILDRLRSSRRCAQIPVVIMSSSPPKEDADRTEFRADRYFTKPSDYDKFMLLGGIIKDVLQEENR